jgi:hypothetical protein
MGNNSIINQFRGDEIAKIDNNLYPKIGGRLRLAHQENHKLSIATNIIKYDGKVAVVSATSITSKGSFQGFGTASIERDKEIAPAILELAETRAIARSLRFAGYGVEYCSAEEVSHLMHRNGIKPISGHQNYQSESHQTTSGTGQGENTTILHLSDKLGKSKADLDKHCVDAYGSVVQHLSGVDASSLKKGS